MKRFLQEKGILFLMPGIFLLGVLLNVLPGTFLVDPRTLGCVAITVLWCLSLWQRLVQRNVRRLLIALGIFLLIGFSLQFLRYDSPIGPFTGSEWLSRLLWYAYYIPVLLAPLLGFYASLCLGRRQDRGPLRPWFWLLIPTLALIALVLTNDLHQFCWRFIYGTERMGDYVVGWLYYVVILWSVVLMGAALFLASGRCRLIRAHRRSWVLLPLLLPVLVYLELYQFANGGHTYEIGHVTLLHFFEAFAYLNIAFWETLIRIGMVSSNTAYQEIFRLSSVAAELTDRLGNTVLTSRQEEGAARDPADTRPKSMPVSGGQVWWVEDLSAVEALNRSLEQTAEALRDEADSIRRENELKAELTRYETQNRLYDSLRSGVAPQLARIRELLRGGERAEEEAFRRNLALASVYFAYVKRRANLGLLAEEEPRLDVTSLYLSIRESLEYLRLIGLPCGVSRAGEGELPADTAVRVYELFERTLEAVLPELRAILVDLSCREGAFSLRLELDTEAELPALDWEGRGELTLEREDSSRWLRLTIPEAGVAS